MSDFVPAGMPLLQKVVHFGRNFLSALRFFEKRFCRPRMHAEELWGYYKHILEPLIGPGYFTARQSSKFEVMVDYTQVPPSNRAARPVGRSYCT
jgi:hypothetical protein